MINLITLTKASLFLVFSLVIFPSIAFPSMNTSFNSKGMIEFKECYFESYKIGEDKFIIKSRAGTINLENQEINLKGEVEGLFSLDGNTFILSSENLISNLLDRSVLSKERILLKTKGLEIASSNMRITQEPSEGIRFFFENAHLDEIKTKSKMLKGKANIIELLPSKDLILMKGNAEFYEDDMKILSDEIQYDLSVDRILKSLNATIINIL